MAGLVVMAVRENRPWNVLPREILQADGADPAHSTGKRLLLPDEEYEVPPADNVKPVPKHSRRAKLPELATNGTNQAFNWNIVNRLWAHIFGRGLVHPPDLHHPDNPPTNPALLRQLADHFVAVTNQLHSGQ
jgi:hypothetical protein